MQWFGPEQSHLCGNGDCESDHALVAVPTYITQGPDVNLS